MKSTLSKTQVDRLGDRLRRGRVEDDDLHLLDAYQQSFAEAYALVVGRIRSTLGLQPTGRPVVDGIREQEETLRRSRDLFEDFIVVDRRERPSHGYRAVHVIVKSDDRLVEIQLRTVLQDFWAEFCERMSDFDPTIKYGGGDESDQWILSATSDGVAEVESRERELLDLEGRFSRAPTRALQARIEAARSSVEAQRKLLIEIISDNFPRLRGNGD
ncbi:MAG: hypothetical protein ACRD2A_25765, partial [Vicinamibacterales bacterium]